MSTQITEFLGTLYLIGGTTIPGVTYGITFALYCLCARSLYLQLQKPDQRRRRAMLTLGCISFLFLCVTALLALNTRFIQLFYVDHVDSSALGKFQTACNVIDLVVEALIMGIQIWRLRIIWSGTRYSVVVIIPAILLLLCYLALDPIPIIIIHTTRISNNEALAIVTASGASLSGLTVFVTGMIVARMLLLRRRQIKILGTSDTVSPYVSVTTMLVESYALETTWSLVSTITAGVKSPITYLFSANDTSIRVITYFIIVYRVAIGRGWTAETEETLSSLRFNHGQETTTDEISGIRSRVPPTTTVMSAASLPTVRLDSAV